MNTEEMRIFYEEANFVEDQLPYETKFGFTVGKLSGSCPTCSENLEFLKGRITEFERCIDVRMLGVCQDCKLIVECHPIRYYKDGRCMMRHEKLGWLELSRHSGENRLLSVLKKIGIVVLAMFLTWLILTLL